MTAPRAPGRAPVPTEAQVEQRVQALYRAAGCRIYRLSQGFRAERGGTRQTPGLPDLYVVPPAPWRPWWHETKRPGGKLRPEQAVFREESLARGVGHVVGGVPEAEAHLVDVGLARDLGHTVLVLPPSARRLPPAPTW